MKLIQNSVDKDNLLLSVSNVELDVGMANFQTVQLNGPKIEERFSQKVPLEEEVQMTKMSNGIHETLKPTSNKISNGYCNGVSEEDYQLVLDSSSEEGESPSKKIDEDCISAPQLVQEIEDLLGIDSNTVVGMDDELVKESGDSNVTELSSVKEKCRGIIVNGEVLTGESLEIEDVSEQTDESEVRTQEEEPDEKARQITSEASKHNSSPKMDLVVDDIEIKSTMDISSSEELEESEVEYKLDSVEEKKTKLEETKVLNVNICESPSKEPDSSENEIVSSQVSNLSEVSEEWTVVDSVETDDEDVYINSKPEISSLTDQETNESMVVDRESQPEAGISTEDKTTNEEGTRKRCASPNGKHSEQKKPKLECGVIPLALNNLQVLKRPNVDPADNELKRTKLSDVIPDNETPYNSSQEETRKEEYIILDSIDEECPIVESEKCTVLDDISDECLILDSINKECEKKSVDEDVKISEEAKQKKFEKEKSIVNCKESEEYSTLDDIHDESENKSVDEDGKNSEEAKLEESEKGKSIVNCNESEEYLMLDNINEECENKSVDEDGNISEESRNGELDKEKSIVNCKESEKCPTLDNINEECENRSVEDGNTFDKAKEEEFAEEQCILNLIENEDNVTSKETVVDQSVEPDHENKEAVNRNSLNISKKSSDKQDSTGEEMEVGVANSTSSPIAHESKDCSTECPEAPNITSVKDEIITSVPNTTESIVEKHIESSHKEIEETMEVGETIDSNKKSIEIDSVGDENKENVKTACSSADESCKIGSTKTEEIKTDNSIKPVITVNSEKNITKKTDCEKDQSSNCNSNDKINATKPEIKKHSQAKTETQRHIVKHIERVLGGKHRRSESPFELLKKNLFHANEENKKKTNLDSSIDDVVETSRKGVGKMLPVLTKFHKDQLKKMTRSDLEEIVVMKICEAITDRSQLGQMRLRCQDLEQNISVWRKKSLQLEKQNRELEMVLKRFLNEKAQSNDQDKVALPIKVTRSVGLQVVLASSMNASLITSKAKLNAEIAQNEGFLQRMQQQKEQQQQKLQQHRQQLQQQERQQQQQQLKQRLALQKQAELAQEQVRTTAVFTPPVQPVTNQRRGRPSKPIIWPAPVESPTQQPSTSKSATSSSSLRTLVPLKPATPSKDLEVIDLTEKEEKAKAASPAQSPAATGIKVTPTSQVCFVQQTVTTSNQTSPMAYLVQKSNPRQYLVTTTSASPPKPAARPLPALATPVFRPAAPTAQPTPKVTVRTSSPVSTPVKRPGSRLQNQNPTTTNIKVLQDLSPNSLLDHERQFDDFSQSDLFQYYARPHMPPPESFMSYLNQTGTALTTLNEVNIPNLTNETINRNSALRLFKCMTCGKDFKQKNALQQHERIHTDSRPYCCLECGKTFRQQSHLDQHLRIHSNKKPFACTVCSRTFRQLSILNQHLLIHSGERPHRCPHPDCGKQFRQKTNLNQHVRRH